MIGTTSDLADNTETTQVTLNIDKTAPTITPNVDRAVNTNGWYDNDVTVTFTCTDSLSGVANCPASITVSSEGENQLIEGSATDLAGNTVTTSISINIDKTIPNISIDSPVDGALLTDNPPTITVSYSDNLGLDINSLSLQTNGQHLVAQCNTTASGASCVPDAAFTGVSVSLTVSIADLAGNSDQAAITVTVNTPPTITSTAPTTARVGIAFSYDVEATDPDIDDTLTYSLNTAPMGMTIDANTGLISWTPSATGEYEVTVSVTDNITIPATQTFTITVPNTDPVIISTPITVASINESYQYQVQTLEADGDTLEYSFVTAPFGMTITSDTGLVEWVPIEGQYLVEISVGDGQFGTDTQLYTLTVIDPNINYAPEITSEAVIEGLEGVLYEYSVEATDLNNDTLTYSLITAPTGMTIDAESGLISWISPLAGFYAIEVIVEDPGGMSDPQIYTLSILTLPEADAMFQFMWDGVFQDLISGNKAQALSMFTPVARTKYDEVFDILLPDMQEIIQGLSPMQRISITEDISEYIVSSTIDGETSFYLVYFLKNDDGIWQLHSM